MRPRSYKFRKLYLQCHVLLRCCLFCLQGQILANLKAMDSDWFAQNYIGRSSKVCACIYNDRNTDYCVEKLSLFEVQIAQRLKYYGKRFLCTCELILYSVSPYILGTL